LPVLKQFPLNELRDRFITAIESENFFYPSLKNSNESDLYETLLKRFLITVALHIAQSRGLDKEIFNLKGRNGRGLFSQETANPVVKSWGDDKTFDRLLVSFDFRSAPVETLGLLYEELLSYSPCIDSKEKGKSALSMKRHGVERRISGSFYTNSDIVTVLVETALKPAAIDALKSVSVNSLKTLTKSSRRAGEKAILAINVVDPSCGGGAFLIGALHYLAKLLAKIREASPKPQPEAVKAAGSDILKNCIHGVDRDPIAVDITRFNLWLVTGGSTPFIRLHENIKVGDSLVGVPLNNRCETKTNRHMWTAGIFGSSPGATVNELAGKFAFFHWPEEFPHVFLRPKPGFDCVLGNPPWERIKVQEKEFFARHAPEVSSAGNAAMRTALIDKLQSSRPGFYQEYRERLDASAALRSFFRKSGRYDLALCRDLNLYLFFAVLSRDLLAPRGLAGIVVPSGIATDYGARAFFRDIVEKQSLVSLFDFVNTNRIFPSIAGPNRFSLLTMGGRKRKKKKALFRFYATDVADLKNKSKLFSLSRKDLALLNPNTGTCPPFQGEREAELMKRIRLTIPVLKDESTSIDNGDTWEVRLWNMFHMSGHSQFFRTKEELEDDGFSMTADGSFRKKREIWLRLYESKLMHNLNHRYNTFEGTLPERRVGVKPMALRMAKDKLVDPTALIQPRYWAPETMVTETLKRTGWERRWFLAMRAITNVTTNRRSAVASIIPWSAVGNSASLILTGRPAEDVILMAACLSSLAFDYLARMKLGGPNMNFFILKQIPMPPPSAFDKQYRGAPLRDYVKQRALELIYTASDLEPFASDLDYHGFPFSWNEQRREKIQAELDAVFFMIYGFSSQEVNAALDTFPILRRKEIALHGAFRTKDVVLENFQRQR